MLLVPDRVKVNYFWSKLSLFQNSPCLADCLIMSVTNNLSLANCIVIASLCKGLVTNFYVLLKHLKHNTVRLDTLRLCPPTIGL